jgi:hypothetical protein
MHEFLALAVDLSQAKTGALFVMDQVTAELVCRAAQGIAQAWLGPVWAVKTACQVNDPPAPAVQLARLPPRAASNAASLMPLFSPGRTWCAASGWFQPGYSLARNAVFRLRQISRNGSSSKPSVRVRSLNLLIGIFQQIGATLDRDKILWSMVDYAREVIGAEASSLFLVDEERGDIVLHVASNKNEHVKVDNVRVPAGKGIICSVIEMGQVVLVPDTAATNATTAQ